MMNMEFSVVIKTIQSDFDVAWGDTVRRRDIYTPFYTLSVRNPGNSTDVFPALHQILLYSFSMIPANVHDRFDTQAYWRRSPFNRIELGATLVVSGPVHRIRADHHSLRFGGYEYVILMPEQHGREYDVNGDLNGAVTEWLIEEDALAMENIPSRIKRLVVAWECASLLA